jgi:transcriptional regulator with XRE-family HTH domain
MVEKKNTFRSMAIDSPLRRWRRAHHYTQAQFAELVGAKRDAVNRWEQGKRVPHSPMLRRLVAITRIPAEAIIDPERYLRDHPDYLAEWAEQPPRRGRRPRPRPEEGRAQE